MRTGRGGSSHWPEYLIEAAGLGCFMLAACLFASALTGPGFPVAAWISSPLYRRMLMGVAMGGTAIALIYSPWGRRSGAHFNPAVTLAFLRLGKIHWRDAAGYVVCQIAGGLLGVLAAWLVLGDVLRSAAVNFVVTVPGEHGAALAFAAEFGMSCVLMTVVLGLSNSRLTRWTGVAAGCLVATFISTLAPVSGMSMNPARSLASAVPSHIWTAFWVYAAAPPLGMLSAAAVFLRFRSRDQIGCPKLDRINGQRCIFCGADAGHAPSR